MIDLGIRMNDDGTLDVIFTAPDGTESVEHVTPDDPRFETYEAVFKVMEAR